MEIDHQESQPERASDGGGREMTTERRGPRRRDPAFERGSRQRHTREVLEEEDNRERDLRHRGRERGGGEDKEERDSVATWDDGSERREEEEQRGKVRREEERREEERVREEGRREEEGGEERKAIGSVSGEEKGDLVKERKKRRRKHKAEAEGGEEEEEEEEEDVRVVGRVKSSGKGRRGSKKKRGRTSHECGIGESGGESIGGEPRGGNDSSNSGVHEGEDYEAEEEGGRRGVRERRRIGRGNRRDVREAASTLSREVDEETMVGTIEGRVGKEEQERVPVVVSVEATAMTVKGGVVDSFLTKVRTS